MLTVAKYDRYDLVNTPQTDKPAFTIWFSGCSIGCPDCYNKRLWNKSAGAEHNVNSVIFTVCHQCDHQDIKDVVLLGGEPMEQDIMDLTMLVQKLSGYGYRLWLYTGWEFDQIPQSIKRTMYTIKCGTYDDSLKCDGIPSSTNQQFYRKNADGDWEEIYFREDQNLV